MVHTSIVQNIEDNELQASVGYTVWTLLQNSNIQ